VDQSMFLYSGTLELDPVLDVRRQQVQARRREPEAKGDSWLDDLEVALDLDLARNAAVQVEMPLDDSFGALYASLATVLLEARLDGELQLGLKQGELGMQGEVQPTWGRADILGARFELDGGTVAFAGGSPYDPILDLHAVHSAGAYGEVTVDITGTLDELGLSFGSELHPDELDIISILVLGKPVNELSAGEGEGDELSMVAGALLGELERMGGGAQVVDTLEIDATQVKGGKALGDDVFLTVAFKNDADQEDGENNIETTVDWTISRRLNAEFVTGDQGASSADIYWTWRF